MSLATLSPIGPHVTGVIRFASEGQGDDFRQLDEFEVLSRVHELTEDADLPPKLRPHPISESLKGTGGAQAKLQCIPVILMFDKPENNLLARYEAFDQNINRLVCVGDGENCARANFAEATAENHDCKGPDACSFANSGAFQCQLRVRLAVQIDGQHDPLSVFEVQSGGIHTYRTLQAKLQMLKAILGGSLRNVPLNLTMYAKSSPAHEFKPFYVADLVLRDGANLQQVIAAQKTAIEAEKTAGLSYSSLETEVEAIRTSSALSIGDDDSSIIPYVPRMASRGAAVRPIQPLQLGAAGSASRTLGDVVAKARREAEGVDQGTAAAGEREPRAAPAVVGMELPSLAAASSPAPAAEAEAPLGSNATIEAATELPPSPL